MSSSTMNATDPAAAGDPFAGIEIPDLDPTYGSYLIGTFLGLIAYGLVLHQVYRYGRLYPTDTLFMRYLVALVMFIQTVHAIANMHTCYYYLVSHFFQPATLETGVWSLNATPLIVGVNMIFSQIFFARRVYLMGSHYRYIVAIAVICFGVELAFSIAALVRVIRISSLLELDQVNRLLAATFGAGALGDTLLTGSLIFVLYQSRKTDADRTERNIANTFLVYVVNTGLLHDVLNIISLIVVLAYPHYLIHGSISIVTTRVYAITLLAVLNSRKMLQDRNIEFLDGSTGHGMHNIISRANRLATQERWNVPQVPGDEAPSVINIKVVTEMDGAYNEDQHARKSMRKSFAQ